MIFAIPPNKVMHWKMALLETAGGGLREQRAAPAAAENVKSLHSGLAVVDLDGRVVLP